MGPPVRFVLAWDAEDDTPQLGSQFFAGFSGELLHIGHIHTGFFRDGNRQSFGGSVHGGGRLMGLNGPFREHIRLSFQLAVLVQHLQGTEQVVAGIIGKSQPVAPVVDKAIFFRKAVIKAVQFRHLRLNVGIGCTGVHLQVNELLYTVPQLHQALDAGFGGGVQVGSHHAAVFPEVHRAVHHREGVVFYVGVSRNGSVDVLALAQFRQFSLLVVPSDVLDGIVELIGKQQSLNGSHRVVLPAVLSAFSSGPPQHHLRVVDEILVDGKAVLRRRGLRLFVSGLRRKAHALRHSSFSHKVLRLCGNPDDTGLSPVRRDVDGPVPLLQEQDVGDHLGPGIGFEGVVWQPDGPQQLGPLSQIPAHGGILGVHCVAGGYKGHHAAGAHLIQRLGEEIVVDVEAQLIVGTVVYLVLSEGDVAHGQVIEVPPVGGLKPRHRDVGLGVELPGNASRNAVQLHAVQPAFCHALREHPEEVAHTHRRLQNVAGTKAHAFHGLIDGADDSGAGVVGVQGGGPGGSVFLRGQQLLQFRILRTPCRFIRVKGIRQTAPANIL